MLFASRINNSLFLQLVDAFFRFLLDQTLLFNLITTSVAFRSSEAWLPICITDVKDDAYLHLYVGFVTEEMYVFFVTTANSPDVFTVYSEMKNQLYNVYISIDYLHYRFYYKQTVLLNYILPIIVHFLLMVLVSKVLLVYRTWYS